VGGSCENDRAVENSRLLVNSNIAEISLCMMGFTRGKQRAAHIEFYTSATRKFSPPLGVLTPHPTHRNWIFPNMRTFHIIIYFAPYRPPLYAPSATIYLFLQPVFCEQSSTS
jgi:hypothetical protein